MPKKEVNTAYKKIVKWLENFGNKNFFEISQIVKEVSLKDNTVRVFLDRRIGKKLFEKKVNPNSNKVAYKMIPETISLEISKGLLSNTVFEKLKEYNLKFPTGFVRESFLLKKINEENKIYTISLNSLHAVIQRWFNDGHLIRNQNPNGYGYRLKNPKIKERPITCD